MNLSSYWMKEVIMATLKDPHIALDFTKSEKLTPDTWLLLTSVLTYLQVPYNLTQLFGAHRYVTVSGALAALKNWRATTTG